MACQAMPTHGLQTQMFLRLVAKKKDQPRHAKNITEHPRTISFNAYSCAIRTVQLMINDIYIYMYISVLYNIIYNIIYSHKHHHKITKLCRYLFPETVSLSFLHEAGLQEWLTKGNHPPFAGSPSIC
jgi:hypothetical protein